MSGFPPIRLDIDDPDYDWTVGVRISVSLDGAEQKHCTAYDCEAGTVTLYRTDEAGRFVVEGGEAVLETVSGVVAVGWMP